jgi:hypothetical protein
MSTRTAKRQTKRGLCALRNDKVVVLKGLQSSLLKRSVIDGASNDAPTSIVISKHATKDRGTSSNCQLAEEVMTALVSHTLNRSGEQKH